MKYIFKLSKVKGNEYLQIWRGTSKANMEFYKQIGSAKKLITLLEKKDDI